MRFLDHAEAGRLLARRLVGTSLRRPAVLAIAPEGPRIAREVARWLDAPMDIMTASAVGIPGRNCGPLGTVVDGAFYPDERACRDQGVTLDYARILAWPEQGKEERWERSVRSNRPAIDVAGRSVIVVSDVALDRDRLVAIRDALQERKARQVLHLAVLARPEGGDLRAPILTITLFTTEESRSVMLVNAGYEQTTESEIAELLAAAGAAS